MRKIQHSSFILYIFLVIFALLFSCIFAPKEGERKTPASTGKWQDPIAPEVVIENLKVAFNDRDIDLFERCLHPDYFYESPSEIDSLDVRWARSEEVRIVGEIFDDCTAFVFNTSTYSNIKEYGSNIQYPPPGSEISDEHPDDIWYIFTYDISMDLYLKTYGDLKVQQFMEFVLVEDPENHWSIIRWIDETIITQ